MKNSLSSISLVLLGAGGHAKSCINLIDSLKNFTIKGILGKKEEVGKDLLGYPIMRLMMGKQYLNLISF